MSFFGKIGRSIVYHTTEKPSHYVHVDKPKSLQDLRQIQYNNWCKTKGVYNGSYLPRDPNKLVHKGWIEITPEKMKQNKPDEKTFQRKSTLQIVRHDDENETQFEHYHWENRFSLKDKSNSNQTFYRDRYGNIIKKGKKESHLAPYDKDYKEKK